MVGCLKYDTMLDVGQFYSDTIAELAKLPTLNKRGTDELSNMNEVRCGSNCVCYEDGEVYFLTGANKWEIYKSSDPSGGGGSGELEYDITSNLTVGALPSGTLLPQGTTFTEFAEKLLITEIAPTISFSISKSGNVVYGSSYTETLTVKATAMGTAKSIDTIEWYQGSTLLQTDTIGSTTTGTWTYTMSTATTSNTTFKCVVKYKKSNSVQTSYTGTASISFFYNKFT